LRISWKLFNQLYQPLDQKTMLQFKWSLRTQMNLKLF
jgi:hypothetical protein